MTEIESISGLIGRVLGSSATKWSHEARETLQEAYNRLKALEATERKNANDDCPF